MRIVTIARSEKKISELRDNEFLLHSEALLIKIHVITGWIVPEGAFLEALKDQWRKKLEEDYSDLNVSEIEFAFRKYASQVEDWGKNLNIQLIDKVLLIYRGERRRVAGNYNELQLRNATQPEIKYSDEDYDNFKRQWTEELYQRYRNGSVEPIPDYTRIILVKDGLIKQESDAAAYFNWALGSGKENIYVTNGI